MYSPKQTDEQVKAETAELVLLKAVDLLRTLHDLQNGPPLEKYAMEWNSVMVDIELFLGEHEK